MARKNSTTSKQYRVYSRGVNYVTPMGDTFDSYQAAADAIPAIMQDWNSLAQRWAYAPVLASQLFVALA